MEQGIAENQAIIIVAEENFHGRTTTIVSFSTDPTTRTGFGPYTPGFLSVRFGDLAELRAVLEGPLGPRVAGAGTWNTSVLFDSFFRQGFWWSRFRARRA